MARNGRLCTIFCALGCVPLLLVLAAEETDRQCSLQKANIASGKNAQIRSEVEEGEAAEFSCKFCDEATVSPVRWFRQNRNVLIEHGEWKSSKEPETEVTADPYTFDEFNRIFVDKANSLIIRNFTVSDVGVYYCRKLETGTQNGFEYYPQVLQKMEPTVLPINQTLARFVSELTPHRPGAISLTRKHRKLTLNYVSVMMLEEPWGECNSCGDIPGEQTKIYKCAVHFSRPTGDFMSHLEIVKLWDKELDIGSIPELEHLALTDMEHLYPSYKANSFYAIRTACGLVAVRDNACETKFREEDPGYKKGMSCRNNVYLKRWTDFARQHGNNDFPALDLIGGVVEKRACKVPCAQGAAGKNKTEKSWFSKLLKLRGINLANIFNKQKKRAKEPVKRHIISEYLGTGIKLSCPTTDLGHMVLWKNGTMDLNPFTVKEETSGRVVYLTSMLIHIQNLTLFDSQIYSCWQNNDLKGEVEVRVVKPKPPPPDMRMALLYLAIGTLADLVIFVALMVVRHRQETASTMRRSLYMKVQNSENRV